MPMVLCNVYACKRVYAGERIWARTGVSVGQGVGKEPISHSNPG